MVRAPFQVLVLPWRTSSPGHIEFAVFRRADDDVWQALSGGGEDDETPIAAAIREAFEEAGIPPSSRFMPLAAHASIPVHHFSDTDHWEDELFVIPEFSFGVEVRDGEIRTSGEHLRHAWLPYRWASRRLTYDSNRIALWELYRRILGVGPRATLPDE